MKLIALFPALLCLSISLTAQDLIHFRDGDVVPARIISVGPTINYISLEDPQGTNYFEYEEEVVKIAYESGETVFFQGHYLESELFVDKLHFFEGDDRIKRKIFIQKLQTHDSEVRRQFVSGNTKNILGYSLVSVGTFVFGFEAENWIYGGAPFRPGVYLLSGGGAVLGFLLEKNGSKQIARALNSYNKAQGITLKPLASANGIGIGLYF